MALAIQEGYNMRSRVGATLHTPRHTRVASSWIKKRRTYFTIPELSIDSVWRGASEIVAKLHFALSSNISLPNFINEAPDNPRFCACVAWKPTSETIVRYKLWEDVGEILYVDLYNGETIPEEFFIEIWNVKPPEGASTGGTLVLDDEDATIVLDDVDATLTTDDSESLIGYTETIEIISDDWRIRTSKLVLPTTKCDDSDIDITEGYRQCTDITMVLEGWNPFDGDYYQVDGDCGETILVPGDTVQVESFKLRCEEDQTWHLVYLALWLGEIYVFVEQDATSAGDNPYVVIRDIYNHNNGYRVNIHKYADGSYATLVEQETAEPHDYNVIYFLVGASYYGLRLAKQNGNVQLIPSQTPL